MITIDAERIRKTTIAAATTEQAWFSDPCTHLRGTVLLVKIAPVRALPVTAKKLGEIGVLPCRTPFPARRPVDRTGGSAVPETYRKRPRAVQWVLCYPVEAGSEPRHPGGATVFGRGEPWDTSAMGPGLRAAAERLDRFPHRRAAGFGTL